MKTNWQKDAAKVLNKLARHDMEQKQKMTDEQLCKMLREVDKLDPNLTAPKGMKYTRTEIIGGKPVRCYKEK